MDGVILSQTDGTNTMYFQYDIDGAPLGLNYNGKQYLYMTNQMGDVCSIVSTGGKEVVQYEYDEWGNTVSIDLLNNTDAEKELAEANPIRYRGYYLDSETGYYYLQSRYYDPNICRFINADIFDIAYECKEEINGTNLFAYCCNNPINYEDSNGYKYSPSKAQAYADKWWNKRNPHYKSNSKDCANFVSQCLYAGGLSKMTGSWYHKVYTYGKGYLGGNYYTSLALYGKISADWGIADNLYKWLKKSGHCSKYSVVNNQKALNSAISSLYGKSRCLAAVFFDFENDGKINHAAMSGMITRVYDNKNKRYNYYMYYYAHTDNRAGDNRLYKNKKISVSSSFNGTCKAYICWLK